MQPEQPSDQPNEPQPGWQFTATDNASDGVTDSPLPAPPEAVSWSASEFVSYQKSAAWYAQVLFVVAVFAGAVYLLTRDIISIIALAAIGIIFVVYAGRKPRVLTYTIDNSGVHIGSKTYHYGQFKSFSVIDEGNIHSIMLVPIKRFMPGISMYFEPKDEQRIAEALGQYLPHEDRKQDAVDKFMHKIRF